MHIFLTVIGVVALVATPLVVPWVCRKVPAEGTIVRSIIVNTVYIDAMIMVVFMVVGSYRDDPSSYVWLGVALVSLITYGSYFAVVTHPTRKRIPFSEF